MSSLEELYNDLYENGYHKEKGFSHSKNLIKYLLKYNKAGDKVLDVGCSNGTAMGLINQLGMEAYGIDISDVAISKLKFKNCKQGYAENIPYENDEFNAILCTDVIEHLPPQNIDKCFSEFSRVVNDKGIFYLKIATKVELNKCWQKILDKHNYKSLHLTIWSNKDWVNYLSERFKVLEITRKKDTFIEMILENGKL